MKEARVVTVAQLAEFDEIVDVRSPSEFAEDHIPGAVNCPVLDDEERARIGILYKQVSSFEAKKIGAAVVSRNIARHIEQQFILRPKSWQPLVYCWRGGKRSGAMTHIFIEIGWAASQLDGGYRAYRRYVLECIDSLPRTRRWRVVCGLTGSGKSRLLNALQETGAQVLDLERLACHRGSVLGNLPDTGQPFQKMFESLICAELKKYDPAEPVYVEAESKKIGALRVPEALIEAMWQGECIRLETDQKSRVSLLKEEYAHFFADPEDLKAKLDLLASLYGNEAIKHWKNQVSLGDWDPLVAELLEKHYDPAYAKSTLKHYPRYANGLLLRASDLSDGTMRRLALQAKAWKP